jgi:hypothetical protein
MNTETKMILKNMELEKFPDNILSSQEFKEFYITTPIMFQTEHNKNELATYGTFGISYIFWRIFNFEICPSMISIFKFIENTPGYFDRRLRYCFDYDKNEPIEGAKEILILELADLLL